MFTTFLLSSLVFTVKAQLNYHIGMQFPFAAIKSTQFNIAYDFMKKDQLYFGLYSGYQITIHNENQYDQKYMYYRFPFGIKYYFKTKKANAGYAPFLGISYNVSPIIKTKVASYDFYPDITNLGFGIALGTRVFLAKRWEILVSGNYNFDYDSIFPENSNRDNILFQDSGILMSIGYNINLSQKAKRNKTESQSLK